MRKYIMILFLLLLLPTQSFALEKEVKLSNCVDSNSASFIENIEAFKVKFIGIESPSVIESDLSNETETEDDISIDDYVCDLLTSAKSIKIEIEEQNKDEDKLGRTQVWVKVDGVLLQELLVSLGYARTAYLYDGYKYKEELLNAEAKAKEEKLGVWKEKEVVEEVEVVNNEEEKEKSFFQMLLNFINEMFEGIIKFFDNLIKRWVE